MSATKTLRSRLQGWLFGSKAKEPLRVVISDAGSDISPFLAYSLANGSVLGLDQPISLMLLESETRSGVEDLIDQLNDCGLPLLREINHTCDAAIAFKDVDVAILIRAVPVYLGMNRQELIKANFQMFRQHAEALNQNAKRNVKVLTVGNLSNTHAFICSMYAPGIPAKNFTCLSLLNENRVRAEIGARIGTHSKTVWDIVVWGNQSCTMFPDVSHAKVNFGKGTTRSVGEAVADDAWLKNELVKHVQDRAHLLNGLSTANAICDHLHAWFYGTSDDHWVCMGVQSDGSYGIDAGVFYSFPVKINPDRTYSIIQGLWIDDFAREKMDATLEELLREKDAAMEEAACGLLEVSRDLLLCTPGCCGLINLGNTCYSNVTVQLLCGISSLVDFILKKDRVTGGMLAKAFSELVELLFSGTVVTVTPGKFKLVAGRVNAQFADYSQQDAMDFLSFLLHALHQELMTDDSNTGMEANEGRSIIMDTFQGRFQSKLSCTVCDKESVKLEPFTFISVPVPCNASQDQPDHSGQCEEKDEYESAKKKTKVELADCIHAFTDEEIVDYSVCGEHEMSTKQVTLYDLPPVVIIQMKRFAYSDRPEKLDTFVQYPVRGLNLQTWAVDKADSDDVVYDLIGVVNHIGDRIESGHFTVVVKNISNGLWYRFRDADVAGITEDSVVSNAAYLLAYQRRDNKS